MALLLYLSVWWNENDFSFQMGTGISLVNGKVVGIQSSRLYNKELSEAQRQRHKEVLGPGRRAENGRTSFSACLACLGFL